MNGHLSRAALWDAVHVERARLADDLQHLDDQAWATMSLCPGWTVENVVAHLTAAATVGRFRWLSSMLAARFDPDLHNQRRMLEHLGDTPQDTLRGFRAVIDSTTAPSGHTEAWLGEVVVHGADIRQPLGIDRAPPVETVTAVARFFAGRDFTVASASAVKGLRLEATDGPLVVGEGPEVRGTTLALTMAMAGRSVFLGDLTGAGVATLAARCRDEPLD